MNVMMVGCFINENRDRDKRSKVHRRERDDAHNLPTQQQSKGLEVLSNKCDNEKS
jgi:hypothetical protein